jgi:hypothetical protein
LASGGASNWYGLHPTLQNGDGGGDGALVV